MRLFCHGRPRERERVEWVDENDDDGDDGDDDIIIIC